MTTVGTSETRPDSSPPLPLDAGAFAPGTMLADRYRIVALVGRGGMGEVYRAEDLRLRQTVALKFLPARLEHDAAARERLLAEVRNARSVAHPNVCRVYDVGDVRGRWFLTMEYIDGEDLASLLCRIGRLPADKATEIARQVAAGLAALHDKGVLHRDLKPANVMIDGRGQARITDFGLAVDVGKAASPADFAGTSAYMAPERFEGLPATAQSDIYSLGLILYETFTGKPAFKATTIDGWRRLHTDSTPAHPSHLVSDMPPAAERAILRCLEKDPSRRPVTAAQVAAALPGGDPLAAAIAAGETPSPELVAASGEEGTLPRGKAWLYLAACAAAFAALMMLESWRNPANLVVLPHPELQQERARGILRDLGYSETARDRARWIRRNTDYLSHFRNAADGARALDRAIRNPLSVLFCYRQSPVSLVTRHNVSANEPAPTAPGDAYVELDISGRLVALRIVPTRNERSPATPATFDWSPLLDAAGLKAAQLTTVEPAWGPVHAFDARAAWEGAADDEHVRVEAAAWRGRASYLQVSPTWMAEAGPGETNVATAWPLLAWIGSVLTFGGFAFLAVLALRNMHLGRGDRRGAYRLSLFIAALGLVGTVLGRHWSVDPGRPQDFGGSGIGEQISGAVGLILFYALSTWVAYIGFEPYVRRRWPHLLIASTRLLDGRWRDPLVGRSLLSGTFAALTMMAAILVAFAGLGRLGWGTVLPPTTVAVLYDLRSFVAYLAVGSAVFTVFAIVYLAVLLAARFVLRSTSAAWVGLVVTMFVMYSAWSRVFLGGSPAILLAAATALAGTTVFVLWHNGLLALAELLVVMLMLRDTPWTSALGSWYAWPTWCSTALIAALLFWGFRNVLGHQSVFPTAKFDD